MSTSCIPVCPKPAQYDVCVDAFSQEEITTELECSMRDDCSWEGLSASGPAGERGHGVCRLTIARTACGSNPNKRPRTGCSVLCDSLNKACPGHGPLTLLSFRWSLFPCST